MILSNLKALSTNERLLMKNVVTIVITLVNGATTATPERSFSMTRRIKARLHTTMTHRRFNALPTLNSSKSLANKLSLVKVVIDFVHSSPNRRNDLGFSQKRIWSNDNQAEAAIRGVLWKKMFLEISQNSQENTCARVSLLIKFKKETLAQVFLWILRNFYE